MAEYEAQCPQCLWSCLDTNYIATMKQLIVHYHDKHMDYLTDIRDRATMSEAALHVRPLVGPI